MFKRSRDMSVCQECEEEYIDTADINEEWDVCGDCQRMMCKDCCSTKCKFCEETAGEEETALSWSCCEMCMVWCPKCEEAAGPNSCGNTQCYHKCCLQHHMKVCNSQSRAQGAYAAATMERESTEKELASAKQELSRAQNRVARLTSQLEQNNKDEAQAKETMDQEC